MTIRARILDTADCIVIEGPDWNRFHKHPEMGSIVAVRFVQGAPVRSLCILAPRARERARRPIVRLPVFSNSL